MLAEIDAGRRRAISRAHTATHLVHQTMRNFLGESATQAGSLNAPGRLRFDFNTPQAVSPTVLRDVEEQVNEVLMRDLEVHAYITSQEEARRSGRWRCSARSTATRSGWSRSATTPANCAAVPTPRARASSAW